MSTNCLGYIRISIVENIRDVFDAHQEGESLQDMVHMFEDIMLLIDLLGNYHHTDSTLDKLRQQIVTMRKVVVEENVDDAFKFEIVGGIVKSL